MIEVISEPNKSAKGSSSMVTDEQLQERGRDPDGVSGPPSCVADGSRTIRVQVQRLAPQTPDDHLA